MTRHPVAGLHPAWKHCGKMGAGASATAKALTAAVNADDAAVCRTADATPKELGNALHLAARNGSLVTLQALLSRGDVDVNHISTHNGVKVTALKAAIQAHQVEAVIILLGDPRAILSSTRGPFRKPKSHEREGPLHLKYLVDKAEGGYREGVPLLMFAATVANPTSMSHREGEDAQMAIAAILAALLAEPRVTVEREIGLAALTKCVHSQPCITALAAQQERTGADADAIETAKAEASRGVYGYYGLAGGL